MSGSDIGIDLYVPSQYLKQALLVSLLSVWVLVGLFFYLNHHTRRRYFTIWATGWLFYALWLTLNSAYGVTSESTWLLLFKLWCISSVALFLFWGSARFLGQRVGQLPFALFMMFLYTWGYYGIFHLDDYLQIRLPVFGLIGLASLKVAWCFFLHRRRHRLIGAGLLATGFALWGGFHVGYPFLYSIPELFGAGFLISAVLQLFIAVGMIVLVLEEGQQTRQLAYSSGGEQDSEITTFRALARVAEDRYRRLFDQAGEAIVIARPDDLRIVEINQSASVLLGIRQDEARGRSFADFCRTPEASPDKAPTGAGNLWQWIVRQHPLVVKRKNGTEAPVEALGAVLEQDDQPLVQLFLREQTDRERVAQQLRQAEKLAALGQMLSSIAQEIDGPLRVARDRLETALGQPALNPEVRRDLETAARESRRAAALVRNFLSFARERPMEQAPVDANASIQQVLKQREEALQVARVQTDLQLEQDLPLIMADAGQVQQVLLILINNALQAMAVLDKPGRLEISSRRVENFVELAVRDTGPGILPQMEAKIFEPAPEADESAPGPGRGLSVAQRIMTAHAGRIFCQRPLGGGARLLLLFPVVEKPAANAACAGAGVAGFERLKWPGTDPAAAAEVLVLDGERFIAELLGELLRILGYKATCSASAPAALESIRSRSFDLILCDIRTPGLSAPQFFEAVRQHNPGISRRIVFLTGDKLSDDFERFLAATGNQHFPKPFELGALRRTIEHLLEPAGKEAAPGTTS